MYHGGTLHTSTQCDLTRQDKTILAHSRRDPAEVGDHLPIILVRDVWLAGSRRERHDRGAILGFTTWGGGGGGGKSRNI